MHKYENVQMIYNVTEYTPDGGAKAFGAGIGYDSTLIFDGCSFVNNGSYGEVFAVHGINEDNPDPCVFRLIMKDSYIKGKTIYYNLFDADRDEVDFFLSNNSFGVAFDGSECTNLVEFGDVLQS
jgi:hypothetical protein